MPINVVTDLFNRARFLLYISKTKEFKDFAVEQQLSTSQREEIAKQILVKHINPINSKLHLIEKLNECDHNENNYNLISLFIITNKDKLIRFVNNDFSSFKEILNALKSGKGQIKFIKLMSNQLPTIINDSYKLQQILDILQEEDDVKYCLLDSLSDHLPNILQLKDTFPSDIATLKHFFNSKKQTEKKAVWKSTLEDILSPQDFIVLKKFINSEDSPDLSDPSYLKQITSIKYFLDLRDLTRIFLSKKPFIFNSIKDQLIAIIDDSYRLQQILILSQLEDSQNIILNALSKELPRIIKDTPDLKRLLESALGSKNQLFVIDLLNENLKYIIKNTDDLIQIIKILPLNDLNLLSPVNKENEVNRYKHFIDLLRKQEHLSTIVRNPEDWINLISNTPENKKEVIYKLLKEDFLPEIISSDLNSFLDFFVKKIPETTSKNEYETLINFLKDNLDISGIIRNIEDLNLLISAIPEDISKEKYQILINFPKDQQNTSELIKNIEDLNSFIKSIPEDISKEKYQIIIESLKDQKYLSNIIQQTEDLNEFIKKIPGNLSKEKYEIIISYLLNNKYFSRIINHTSLLSVLINTIPDSIQEDKYQIIIDLLREQFAFTIKSEEQLGHFIKKIRDDLPKNKYQIIINALKDLSLNITNDVSSFNSFIESIPEKFTEEKNKILINFLKEQKNISGVINNYEDLKCFLSIIPVPFSKWQNEVLTDFLKNQKYYSKIINNRDDLLSFLKNIPEDMSAKTYQIFIDFLRDQQDISGNINNIESLNLFIASIPESISEEKYQILIDFLKDQQDISEVIKSGSDLKSFLKNIPSNISTNKYEILVAFLEKQRHFLVIINNNENFNLFIENLQEDKHQSTIEKIRRMQCFPTELFILYDIRSEANDPHWKKNEISFPFLRKAPNGVQEIQNIINNDTNNNAKEKAKLIYHIVNKELNPSTFSGKMSLFLNSLFRKIFRKKDVNAFYKKCQEKTKPYADTIDDTIKEKHSDDTYRVDFDKKDQDYDFNQNLVVSNISSSYIVNKPNFFKHTTNCNDTNNKEEKQNLTKTRGNKI